MSMRKKAAKTAAKAPAKPQAAPPDWKLFLGTRKPTNAIKALPPAPKWRQFKGVVGPDRSFADPGGKNEQRGSIFHASEEVIRMVNAALYLRRPLLITGLPGSGKSSLIYAVAHELGLGRVLRWNITSRSNLGKALYTYDAIGRLQASQLEEKNSNGWKTKASNIAAKVGTGISDYLQLGPLGTALLPTNRPRALLIDEIDKSDIDLPNDLLNIFEEGEYEIPELARLKDSSEINIRVHEGDETFPIVNGKVLCKEFPFVILTSNGEREFPPAFLRRCLRLTMPPPKNLAEIIEGHLGKEAAADAAEMITKFTDDRGIKRLATDQLMNAIFMVLGQERTMLDAEKEELKAALLRELQDTGIEDKPAPPAGKA